MSSDALLSLSEMLSSESMPGNLLLLQDADNFERVFVLDQSILQTPFGTYFAAGLVVEEELSFKIPALPLSLVGGAAAPDGIVAARALLEEDWYIELEGLKLALRFDPVLLRPVDPMMPHAEIRAGSGLIITKEGIDLTDPAVRLSLPPSEIARTGIIVALEGVQLDISEESTPPEIADLGYDETFQGVYAERASIQVLPELRLGAHSGLELEAENLVIGPSGVSCFIRQDFFLDHDGSQVGTGSEAVGELLGPAWPLALSSVEAEIHENEPRLFSAQGVLRVPFFDLLFDLDFGMQSRPDGDGYQYIANVVSSAPGEISTRFGTIRYEEVALDGNLEDEAIEIRGVISGLEVDLDPLGLTVQAASVDLLHESDRDELRLRIDDVEFGPLGTVDVVDLVLEEQRTETGVTRDVRLEVSLSWEDLKDRVTIPSHFPAPPDSGTVKALATWHDDEATGQRRMALTLVAELDGMDQLWRFLPAEVRPEVRRANLKVEILYNRIDDFANATSSSTLAGALGADLELRLPQDLFFPEHDVLATHTGDPEGWISCTLRTGLDAQGNAFLTLLIKDPLSVDVQLPGLTQPEPPIHLELTGMEFDLQGGIDQEGKLGLSGKFELRPISPPATVPVGAHLQRLLAPIEPGLLSGTAELELKFKGDRAQLDLSCDFAHASVKIDVFDLVANLSRGFAPPAGVPEPAGDVDLDLDVGFALRNLGVRLGSLDPTGPSPFSVELGMTVTLAGLTVDGHLRLSEEKLAIGVTEMRVPMRMPRFPLTRAEVEDLETDADWNAALDDLREGVEALEGLPDTDTNRKQLARLQAQLLTFDCLWQIRERLAGPSNVQTYQTAVTTVLGILDATTGVTHFESDVELVLSNVEFVVPFSDPRGIGLEGEAHLEGFAQDDPFAGLEGVELGLGLSADRIFFSVESLSQPIPLPDFGRYPGGSVDLSQLTLGYGYTKNSFSMTFAGELVLPPQLIEDADTSRELGVGIRLPSHTRLGFKLDLVPVPGPIPLVPLFEFDLDMRSSSSPALVRSDRCEPFWDGLQVIVPNLYRSDLKQIAASPVLGILPIPNARFDGDLMLGSEKNGLTVVMDNFLSLAGLSSIPPIPIPFLADPTQPYFDNFCVSLRLAGFGINFNLQRPFPGLSPLALFEALGLLADPKMPIDPQGALANSLRVTVTDAYITLPSEVLRLFPQAESYTRKEVNVTINLGTFIVALQQTVKTSGQIADAIEDNSRSLPQRLEDLAQAPPEFDLGTVLGAVPPEMRKVALSGSFAGFEARAVLLLIDANDTDRLVTEFSRRGNPATPVTLPPLAPGLTPDPALLSRFRPNVQRSPGDARTFYPDEPHNSLFAGEEFAGFEASDLAAIPPPRKPMAGVVVGANVRVFRDQRFRFLGCLFEDGSFGMVSTLDVEPLNLEIAGIDVRLPLELHGRLMLEGRAKRDGYYGSAWAQVQGTWRVIENVLTLSIGPDKPISLELHSDGKFAVKGDVLVKMFNNDATTLLGTVDVSDTHCFVAGTFRYLVGSVVNLNLNAKGRIGPQQRFSISGDGSLSLFGVPLTKVRGTISESGAEIEASLDTSATRKWFAGQQLLSDCRLQLALAGWLDLRKTDYPEFELVGIGELELFGAKVEGTAAIASRQGVVTTSIEGGLTWQNRAWLNGRVVLRSDGFIAIEGRTSFPLALTPNQLPGSVSLAGLFLKVDVGGKFLLDAQNGLAEYDLVVDWTLAAQLPGAAAGQTFPLAMQKLAFSGGAYLNRELIHIHGFDLLPLDNITLTVPTGISVTSELHFGAGWTDTTPAAPVPLYLELPGKWQLPDVQDNESKTELGKIPLGLKLNTEDHIIPLSMLLTDNFRVFLSWQNSQLGITVKSNSESKFVPFSTAFE